MPTEPTVNPRVQRSLRRTFYSMTRRYGEQLTLRKIDESTNTAETDYDTGVRTRDYEDKVIRKAVHVPFTLQRNVTYTPAMMQAIRQYAWQGGAGTDQETLVFMIADRDIRGWGDIDPTQKVIWRGETYQVVSANHFDGGVVINVKAAKGSTS